MHNNNSLFIQHQHQHQQHHQAKALQSNLNSVCVCVFISETSKKRKTNSENTMAANGGVHSKFKSELFFYLSLSLSLFFQVSTHYPEIKGS